MLVASATVAMLALPVHAAAQSLTVDTISPTSRALASYRITPGSLHETSTRIAPGLRLRISTPPAAAMGRTLRVQPRFATAMIDLFPVEGTGFRLSAGTRYHARRDFLAEGDGAGRGLLFGSQANGSGGARRSGFNRFNPAVAMGYTETLGDRLSIGFEVGERKGRTFTRSFRAFRAPRMAGFARHHDGGDFRPIASMTLGINF